MWRRIPFLPMLFGASGALAILAVFSLREPLLVGWRPYVAAAALGAAYVLALYAFVMSIRVPPTVVGAVGCGCFYAAAGYFFLAVVALVGALSTDRSIQVRGAAAIASLLGFVGLGLLGGAALARFRRAEAERQQAALATQAAAFAREQLELARDLQQRLLPPPELTAAGYRITARNVPAAYVAGDFYDFFPLGKDRLLLVLADVAGKGVSAGLIMATVKGMIPFLAAEPAAAASLLGRLNGQMSGHLSAREFVAMAVAIYLPEQRALSIANAGLPDPLLIGADGVARAIVVAGPRYPVGIRKNMSYESVSMKLAPGESVFFFTDGLPEAPVRGEPFGYERLSAEVGRARGEIDTLFAALERAGAEHDDDWTAVLLESTA